MVSKREPNQEKGWKAHLLVVAVIAASVLFILTSAAPAVQTPMAQPNTASNGFQPEPTMNSNVTWSTFYHGWTPLEYSNGAANLSLNANPSSIYPNYISVNPADIQANGTLTFDKLGLSSQTWNNMSWIDYSASGASASITTLTNGEVQIKDNTSTTGAVSANYGLYLSTSNFPSNNLQYDYITLIMGLSGPTVTGVSASADIWNSTTNTNFAATLYPGQVVYNSENLASIQKNSGYGITFNTSGKGTTTRAIINPILNLPESSTTETYTLTIYGIAFTEYAFTLGLNATGATISQSGTYASLSLFTPSFTWSSITGNGYTVAISQPMQNLTTQQTSINDGSFTEEATYQGTFSLPTAPDLSYTATNTSVQLTVPGSQYEVANLNGASYLPQIQARSNGTFTFATVNPNAQNSLVLEVKYTTAQWDASSSPPSFFSLAGLEYYWWATLIAIMSFVGLGSVALSHFGADEEGLRIPKGKFGR